MVTNSFGPRKFMQPMGRLNMHSWWALFFSFWGVFLFLRRSLSRGEKWWQTILETKVACSQWKAQSALTRVRFFSFWRGGGMGGGIFSFFFFLFWGCCHAISPGQKWWQTGLERNVPCSQWKAQYRLMSSPVFFFGGGGGGIFTFFPLFPSCSLCVPMRFPNFPSCSPKTFPIAPQLYPIWFAQSSTLMYTNWKRWTIESTFVSILQLVIQRGASIGEYPMFQKHWWWANQYGRSKQKKKVECAHPWTNYYKSQ